MHRYINCLPSLGKFMQKAFYIINIQFSGKMSSFKILLNHKRIEKKYILQICDNRWVPSTVGIQIRNSKNYSNIVALSIDCRNKHWSQYFNQILISSTGYLTICGTGCSGLQSSLHHNGQAHCAQTTWSNQNSIKVLWSVFISAVYAECHYI